MSRQIADRIRALRLARGWNQTELAERLNVTQATVSRWEKGSIPSATHLTKLADYAGDTMRDFVGYGQPAMQRFYVRGAVAAGVWTEAYEWPKSEWIPYSAFPRTEHVDHSRFGLMVEGESMDQIYPPGTVLDCLKMFEMTDLHNGCRVIVERVRLDGEMEATVKEYLKSEDGRVWLIPRSNNPAFQSPIALDSPGVDEVRIAAIVIGSYRPE